jgi:hypothetical protein
MATSGEGDCEEATVTLGTPAGDTGATAAGRLMNFVFTRERAFASNTAWYAASNAAALSAFC